MKLNEVLAKAAQKGAEIKSLGKMCSDCAFKIQPDINNYSETVEKAADCLQFTGIFHCHTSDYQDAGKVCTGFLYAKQYFESLET